MPAHLHWIFTAAMLVALAMDRAFGEPAARWHPVVGMGRYLGWAGGRIAPLQTPDALLQSQRQFVLGACYWLAGAAVIVALAWALQWLLLRLLPGGWAALLLGAALKPLLAWRMLQDEVAAVEAALGQSLASGRVRLARLVSRDVSTLNETQVRESAIESLAENLNDSVVAPLFWFALLGLPGAALYRFANTADAMWGYRGRWEQAGKWAARADDVLSWFPARLTAALLLAMPPGRAAPALWRQLPAEARRTPSPNSGWPMAAMALRLDVALEKPGVYRLHASGAAPLARETARALIYARNVVLALAVIALAAMLLIAFVPWWQQPHFV